MGYIATIVAYMIGYIATIVALEQKEIVARGYSLSSEEELTTALPRAGVV
jgi:hypothetical protein